MTFQPHPITGEHILFAPSRAIRPRAFGGDDAERCPFCPGHETDTPPTLAATGDPWIVRVFENKFPPAAGAEVIVESPEHGLTFDGLSHASDALALLMDRYRAHVGAAYRAVFKNEGEPAGASIPHLHSQLVPLPFLPPRVVREGAAFTAAACCPLCAPLAGIVLEETDSFTWIVPQASTMPYQQWLVPRRHIDDWSQLTPRELDDLAAALRRASAAMLTLGSSYNWMLMNFPQSQRAHAYVDLVPRLAQLAGLELGSGTFVQIVDARSAADRLLRV